MVLPAQREPPSKIMSANIKSRHPVKSASNEVIPKRGLGQGAISQSFCERVFGICAPFVRSIFLEPIEEGHRGLSLSNYLQKDQSGSCSVRGQIAKYSTFAKFLIQSIRDQHMTGLVGDTERWPCLLDNSLRRNTTSPEQ